MTCPTCRAELWVCEAHPSERWPHCEAVGIPCACNPSGVMPAHFERVAESEADRRQHHDASIEKPH